MVVDKTLIYDVGLHKGQDTDFYLKKGFRVIAFEANPELVKCCETRFASAINEGLLVIVEGAIVSNPHGAVDFYKSTTSLWGTTSDKWLKRNERLGAKSEAISVRSVDFAQCLRDFGIPYYMKIDIEGCDVVCLEALLEFDSSPDFVSIESNKTDFNALVREFDILERLGYQRFAVVQQKTIKNRSAPQLAKEGLELIDHVFESGSSGPFGRELDCKWHSRRMALWRYRWVFLLYWFFGDDGLYRKIPFSWRIVHLYRKLTRKPLPGWYDTHAQK